MNRQNGERMMKGSGLSFVLFILFCLLLPTDGMVDSAVAGDTGADTYGLSSLIKYTLTPWDFRPVSSEVTYKKSDNYPTTIYRTNATGDLSFRSPLHLPSGAKIIQFEIQYCDTGSSEFYASLEVGDWDGPLTTIQLVSSSPSGTPGCVIETVSPSEEVIIDNNDFYNLQVFLFAANDTIRLGGVKVGYKLQVSPAPATATFTDVPTSHPFFKFVEALAASGITGGCGGGKFCPDNAVTRGQMAVFLSAALGLHWPN